MKLKVRNKARPRYMYCVFQVLATIASVKYASQSEGRIQTFRI